MPCLYTMWDVLDVEDLKKWPAVEKNITVDAEELSIFEQRAKLKKNAVLIGELLVLNLCCSISLSKQISGDPRRQEGN